MIQKKSTISALILLHKIHWSVLHSVWIFYSYMIFVTSGINYLRNIGSLSYMDPNVWHISLHNKTIFLLLLPISSVKYLSIWKLSSFQNSNFCLKGPVLSLTKIDIFLEVTCSGSFLRKCMSNNSSLVNNRLLVFFQIKMIFFKKTARSVGSTHNQTMLSL